MTSVKPMEKSGLEDLWKKW